MVHIAFLYFDPIRPPAVFSYVTLSVSCIRRMSAKIYLRKFSVEKIGGPTLEKLCNGATFVSENNFYRNTFFLHPTNARASSATRGDH